MTSPDSTDTDHAAQTKADATASPAAEAQAATLTAEEQLAAAKAETAAHYDRYMRAAADHENFRKRVTREKDELRQYAASRVLEDLLPVLDNLGRGLVAAKQPNADLATLVSGVELVLAQFKSALANHGLTEVNPVDQTFDAHQHEAISQQASASVPEGHVITVVRTGFSLNGRLLRPAAVIVSSGPAKA
ncbi:MAG: nucleotide exchange factor GrpE [Opitutaceae bacterium]|nr:nucleotide exchange factor GrpE [Opitutaceae bacterium]MBP9914287.1 nucleotide exchange factor GrpE [Opitutaceae bacterium]